MAGGSPAGLIKKEQGHQFSDLNSTFLPKKFNLALYLSL
jgi:hypothetical protein